MNLLIPDGARAAEDAAVDIDELGQDMYAYIWEFLPLRSQRPLPELGRVPLSRSSNLAILTLQGEADLGLVADTFRALAENDVTIIASMTDTMAGTTSLTCMLETAAGEVKKQVGQALDVITMRAPKIYASSVVLERVDPFFKNQRDSLFKLVAYSTTHQSDISALTSVLAEHGARIVQLVADAPLSHGRRVEVDFEMSREFDSRLNDALRQLRKGGSWNPTTKAPTAASGRELRFTSLRIGRRPPLWLDLTPAEGPRDEHKARQVS